LSTASISSNTGTTRESNTMNDLPLPRIAAIVGRPNVGKSALFNRLTGTRNAIVHEASGVTRDRLLGEAVWENHRFSILDTGGIGVIDSAHAQDPIEEGIYRQARVAMQDAAAFIQVVDVQKGLMALDEEVARLLRSSGRPVIIAANKADNDTWAEQAADFERLGFPVVAVSALHKLGIDDLVEAVVPHLPPAPPSEGELAPLKVAVVGRPNAGKSSYINRLLRDDRVLVSEIPGTTRDSIDIPFVIGSGPQARHYVFIDTAGIRKRKSVRDAVEQYSVHRAEASIARCDVALLMLDAGRGPSSLEKKIAGLILKENRGCIIVINKWDLMPDEVTQRAYQRSLSEALPFLSFVPVIYTSAEDGYNIRRSVDAIDYVGSQIKLQLTTGVLNRVLHDAVEKHAAPAVKGRRLKFYYATQVGINPVRIRLFVNNPALRTTAYESFLVNALRDAFGFQGAPVKLQFRARSETTKPREENERGRTPSRRRSASASKTAEPRKARASRSGPAQRKAAPSRKPASSRSKPATRGRRRAR